MDRFWPSNGNKVKLESLLHQAAQTYPWQPPILEIFVSNFSGPGDAVCQCYSSHVGSPSDISEVEALNVEIEKADERKVSHIMYAIVNGM